MLIRDGDIATALMLDTGGGIGTEMTNDIYFLDVSFSVILPQRFNMNFEVTNEHGYFKKLEDFTVFF